MKDQGPWYARNVSTNISNCWHGIRCRCCAINGWSFLWCFTWYFSRAYFARSAGGTIALEQGDIVCIDVEERLLEVRVSDEELDKRKRMETTRTESENWLAWTLCTDGNIGEYRSSPKIPNFD